MSVRSAPCGAVQNEGNVPDSPAARLPPSTSPTGPELAPIAEANSMAEPGGPAGAARPSFDSAADEALRSLRRALALCVSRAPVQRVYCGLARSPFGHCIISSASVLNQEFSSMQ